MTKQKRKYLGHLRIQGYIPIKNFTYYADATVDEVVQALKNNDSTTPDVKYERASISIDPIIKGEVYKVRLTHTLKKRPDYILSAIIEGAPSERTKVTAQSQLPLVGIILMGIFAFFAIGSGLSAGLFAGRLIPTLIGIVFFFIMLSGIYGLNQSIDSLRFKLKQALEEAPTW